MQNQCLIPGCTFTQKRGDFYLKVKVLWPSSCVDGYYCEILETNIPTRTVGSKAHYKNELINNADNS